MLKFTAACAQIAIRPMQTRKNAQMQALARGTEEIIAVELDPDPIKRVTYDAQTPMIFDHLQDRNLAANENVLTPARSRFVPTKCYE